MLPLLAIGWILQDKNSRTDERTWVLPRLKIRDHIFHSLKSGDLPDYTFTEDSLEVKREVMLVPIGFFSRIHLDQEMCTYRRILRYNNYGFFETRQIK